MKPDQVELRFSSRMTRRESFAALAYLPIHLLLLPTLLSHLPGQSLSIEELNFIIYAAGLLYMLVCQFGFLRRDFDALCDNTLFILLEVVICYGLMLGFNLLLNWLMAAIGALVAADDVAGFIAGNPNTAEVAGLAAESNGMIAAAAVILAPIVEELMFRGAIFGLLRRKSRLLAYLGSMLLFALYHVWSYAIEEPLNWLYLLQYLPVTYLLCRCYERSNSIWGSIFLHMLINFLALQALRALQGLL